MSPSPIFMQKLLGAFLSASLAFPIFSNASRHSISQDTQPRKNFVTRSSITLRLHQRDFKLPIPYTKLQEKGWSIIDTKPYFLRPFVRDDYYEARTNFSLTKSQKEIFCGGSIIRLLQKGNHRIEATLRSPLSQSQKSHPIEKAIVDSIVVFYDQTTPSIQLQGRELKDITIDDLIALFPTKRGWSHAPNNYLNHPRLQTNMVYSLSRVYKERTQEIEIYWNQKNQPYKIQWTEQIL